MYKVHTIRQTHDKTESFGIIPEKVALYDEKSILGLH